MFVIGFYFQLRYFIFRSWGRVGTSVGSSKLETFHTPNNAMSEFTSLYYEKTGKYKESERLYDTIYSQLPLDRTRY